MSSSVLLCLLVVEAAVAQAPDAVIPAKLSLAEALRLAEQRNPAIVSAHAVVAMAAADQVSARTRPNPAFTFNSEGYGSVTGSPFIDGQELSLRVDQEIERGGRLRLRGDAAEAARRSAQASLEDQRRRLSLDVRRVYFQLVLARADQETARASLAEMDKVIAVNRTRLDQGEISGGEMRRLQAERLRFMDDVFSAELAERNARSALLALLNASRLDLPIEPTESLRPVLVEAVPGSSSLVPGASFSSLVPGASSSPVAGAHQEPGTRDSHEEQGTRNQEPGSTSDLIRDALASRPDVAAARGEQARAESETRLQRALRTPNVTVGGGYKRDFGQSGVIFGVTVPLPVFDRNAGGVARAEAEQQLAASRATAVEAEVALDVQQAVNAVQVNRARVEYIEQQHLQNAREARDIVLASYGAGAIDLTDFLDAQRAFRETQRTYNRALYELRVSLFELDAAMGK